MFVLSIVRPPQGEAKYGKVEVIIPALPDWVTVRNTAFDVLTDHGRGAANITQDEAWLFAERFMTEVGTDLVESRTGLTFRMDKAKDAPHPCPCCDRLVLPTDHAYADAEDAFCLGCFTWDRNTPGCLPQNSAHTDDSEVVK